MKNNYAYFKNSDCEYFPCHKGASENFNCLFCYCPLYALGSKCGGNFKYTEHGEKDCTECLVPHGKNGHSYIMSKFEEISKLAKKEK